MMIQHLHRLQAAQAVMPHLRLGQIIVNAFTRERGHDTKDGMQAIFYASDEELVRAVESYCFQRDQL